MSEQPQPSNVSGSSLLDGVIKFGKEFGVLALIVGFWLGQDAGLIANPVADKLGKIEQTIATLNKDVNEAIQEVKGQNIQHDASMKELTRAVEAQGEQLEEEAKKRQIKCVLRAATEAEKKACLSTKE